MSAAIIALLSVIAQIATSAGVAQIASIVTTLEAIIPVLIKEYQDVAPMIKNIIDALKGNVAITPEQVTQLETMDAQVDQEFEAAAAAAQAEDANG